MELAKAKADETAQEEPAFVWAIAANTRETKHFSAGTKVYITMRYDYTHNSDRLEVYGRHRLHGRDKTRWITLVLPLPKLYDLRLVRVYKPDTLREQLRANIGQTNEQQEQICCAELARFQAIMAAQTASERQGQP